MPGIANYSAWIEVDGKALPEYDIQYSDNGTRATCWVPSEAGKEFIIVYKGTFGESGIGTRVTVDGVFCGGKVIRGGSTSAKYHKGVSTSERTYKPYIFSNCQLTDDDDALGLIPGIGEIILDVEEVLIKGHISSAHIPVTLPPLHIHERAKKGIVHGTQLGEEVLRPPRRQMMNKKIRKLVSFAFRYRPMAVLMADGIAPNENNTPRKNKPLAGPEDILDLTLDDDVHASRKKEPKPRKTTDGAVKTEIKKERSITFDTEVIDLTI